MAQLTYTPEVVVGDLPGRPCIYEPAMASEGFRDTYFIKVPVSALHPVDAHKLCKRSGGDSFVVARSRTKPWVLANTPDRLVRDLACLDAQNMPRDEYFRGKRLRLFLGMAKADNLPVRVSRAMGGATHVLRLIKVEVVS